MEQKNNFALAVFLSLSTLPLLSIYFPRSLSFTPLVVGVLGSFWFVFVEKQKYEFSKAYFLWIGAFGILWLASCFWSVDFDGSLQKVFQSFPVLLFGVAIFSLSRILPLEKVRPYFWVFPFCLGLSACIIAADLYFKLPLYRVTRGMEDVNLLSSAVMNRGVVSIVLSLFAGVFFLKVWDGSKPLKKTLSAFLTLSVSAMLILTQSQSAQFAVLIGFIFILVFPFRYKISYTILTGLFVLFIVLAPWIAHWMWDSLAFSEFSESWLKSGYASNRIEIWDFISTHILKSPFYGYGIESTKLIGNFDHIPIFQKSSSILHPHNFALQIWIEFGLVGVIFCILFVAYFLLYIQNKTGGVAQRVCLGTLMAVLAVSSVGYGMWQAWWLGLLIYLLSLCMLVVRFEQKACQKGV